MFDSPAWECPGDATLYKKIIEKERVFKFLLGLDKSLDEGGGFLEPGHSHPFEKHSRKSDERRVGRNLC